MSNKKTNQKGKNGRKNSAVKVRPLVAELAELEKDGMPRGDHLSGFKKGIGHSRPHHSPHYHEQRPNAWCSW